MRLIDGLLAARTAPGSWLLRVSWRFLPIENLTEDRLESQHWQAFAHPSPEYPLHILLLPRRPLRDIVELKAAGPEVLADLLACVAELVERHQLQAGGYRLITNGGAYQEVRMLHFHLVADRPAATRQT